ncbi:phytanoyl-CoA dioxygenase family protein [Myxococcota bacterium]|nr:phytanoyl-CoA dioxygenase family protein [Myxococcota bacterium]
MTSPTAPEELSPITLGRAQRPKVLSKSQVRAYEHDGFVVAEGLVDSSWLDRLRKATDEFIEKSRTLTESNPLFDLEQGHTSETPRLRRLVSPADLHPTFWEFISESVLVDVVEDLIGPDIKFHHSKLNFKAPHGGEEVRWHQDIQFWPHTNYSPLTIGVFLSDVSEDMGNVGFVPGSHERELFDQYEGDDWVGCLSDADVERAKIERAVFPTGSAGTLTIHNCRTVHGSAPNHSNCERPLLLQTYAAADAFTYTDLVAKSPRGDTLIRGRAARWARHDPRPCQVGPSRVRTIFEVQQRET